ncbi:MAG: hypothetical protein Q9213_001483 [Squamulea squamosa]
MHDPIKNTSAKMAVIVEPISLAFITSTKMAIIIEPISLAFIVYVGYDEFTGKSIGLRPVHDKARLIFMDLFS